MKARPDLSSDGCFLTSIFNIGRGLGGKDERMILARALETRINRSESLITPARLGFDTVTQFAGEFAKEMTALRLRPPTFEDFVVVNRARGYQSRILGKLCHLFVRSFKPVQDDFLAIAISQLQELNRPQVADSILVLNPAAVAPNLLNGRGQEVTTPVSFGKPRKAHSLRILKTDGRTVEFVDDMYVSYSGPGPSRLWSFLTEVEVKTPAAARGFTKQIGMSQFRVGAEDVKEIQMVVEGFRRVVRVTPEGLIFSGRATVRHAVTLLGRREWDKLQAEQQLRLTDLLKTGDQDELYKHAGFRYQSTSRGYGESFCRITLPIPIVYFEPLLHAIWPAASSLR